VSSPAALPRVLVLGTGALGSLIAARLARGGAARVTIAGTWAEGLEAIARDGITVEEETRRWSARVETACLSDTGTADFVLVLAKSRSTTAVAGVAARALAPGGRIVTLQNGLGNREILARVAGQDRVAVGVATLGATLLAPGRIRAFPGRITIGATSVPTLARLLEAFEAAGIPIETTDDIDRVLWQKLAVNCAINPPSALLGLPNGALLASNESRARMAAAAREVATVAAARGIALEADPSALAFEVAAATAGNRSSMLQDLDRGAPTEIDALCGAVVMEGRRLGVATPVNESLWRAVREREPSAAGGGVDDRGLTVEA
jgi:2-dehydropantoate 2-reductase